MLSTEEIREIIENGETGRVEFKSEREKNIDFAKEIKVLPIVKTKNRVF